MSDPEAGTGWIDPVVAGEFPALRLHVLGCEVAAHASPAGVRRRLAAMSDRFHGARAITMRQDPIPSAYRVFFRHIGLDPDRDRPPLEAAAVRRLLDGAFSSHGRVPDALLIGLLETGVPLWAVDAAAIEGELGIRPAAPGEPLGRAADAPPLPRGRLVVADSAGAVAVLFSEPPAAVAPGRATSRVLVYAVQVAGVPAIHVEEALWECANLLTTP